MTNSSVIELSGNPYDRGLQYGSALKDIIGNAISIWKDSFFENNRTELKKYVEFIQEEKYFQEAIGDYSPEYLDEVKGMAKSSGVPFSYLYAWQLADEHYWLVKIYKNEGFVEEEGCSTFGVIKENKQIIMGQNLDIPAYKNGLQIILKIQGDISEQIIFTQAGLLGSFGCNTTGLVLCVNTISQLGYDEKGLPVSYMVRKVLDSNSLDEAEQKLKSIPHASGQNYLLGGEGEIKNYECISNTVSEVSRWESNFLCHTNHPVSEQNKKLINEKAFFGSTSKKRYEQLNNSLLQNNLKSTREIANCLQDSPVFISQQSPTNNIATFHTAYFMIDHQTQAYTFNENAWQQII